MTDKDSSQVQQAVGMWRKAFEDHTTRVAALYEEMNRVEQRAVEQANGAVDEVAKMTRETLAYGSQLAAEWRKLSLEATRRTAELFAWPV